MFDQIGEIINPVHARRFPKFISKRDSYNTTFADVSLHNILSDAASSKRLGALDTLPFICVRLLNRLFRLSIRRHHWEC